MNPVYKKYLALNYIMLHLLDNVGLLVVVLRLYLAFLLTPQDLLVLIESNIGLFRN